MTNTQFELKYSQPGPRSSFIRVQLTLKQFRVIVIKHILFEQKKKRTHFMVVPCLGSLEPRLNGSTISWTYPSINLMQALPWTWPQTRFILTKSLNQVRLSYFNRGPPRRSRQLYCLLKTG